MHNYAVICNEDSTVQLFPVDGDCSEGQLLQNQRMFVLQRQQ